MIINIDLDGVVYRFEPEYRKLVEKATHLWTGETVKLPVATTWSLSEAYGISDTQSRRIFEQGVTNHDLFHTGDMMEEAAMWISRIARRHTVRFVTEPGFPGKPQVRAQAIGQKAQWLADMGLGVYPLILSSGGKQDYHADVVVDDKPKLHQWAQPGSLPILYDQPWNQKVQWTEETAQTLVRATSWQQVNNAIARYDDGPTK